MVRVPIERQIDTLARELEQRRRFLPALAVQRQCPAERLAAELEPMRAALRSLEWMRDNRARLLETFRNLP